MVNSGRGPCRDFVTQNPLKFCMLILLKMWKKVPVVAFPCKWVEKSWHMCMKVHPLPLKCWSVFFFMDPNPTWFWGTAGERGVWGGMGWGGVIVGWGFSPCLKKDPGIYSHQKYQHAKFQQTLSNFATKSAFVAPTPSITMWWLVSFWAVSLFQGVNLHLHLHVHFWSNYNYHKTQQPRKDMSLQFLRPGKDQVKVSWIVQKNAADPCQPG